MVRVGAWDLPLLRDPLGSPWQRLTVPAGRLNPGLYFVRLRAGDKSVLCRALVLP
jgi:hypothetical protein